MLRARFRFADFRVYTGLERLRGGARDHRDCLIRCFFALAAAAKPQQPQRKHSSSANDVRRTTCAAIFTFPCGTGAEGAPMHMQRAHV